MNESNNIDIFEQLLKKNSAKRPINLYNTTGIINKQVIKPQDVLECVYSQIKKIQLADGKGSKMGKVLDNVKKSNFLTVNRLPVYSEVPKQMGNKFETQCVSDTQLINIMEDAEALINTHKGVTQEFETTFTHTNLNIPTIDTHTHNITVRDKISSVDSNSNDIDHMGDVSTQVDISSEHKFISRNVSSLKVICSKVLEDNSSETAIVVDKDSKNEQIQQDHETDYTQDFDRENMSDADNTVDSQHLDINELIVLNDSIEVDNKKERSPSPVLIMKAKPKLQAHSPFIVPLEDFEKFEMLAQTVVSTNEDREMCKHLINSQILGGELYLNTEDILFNQNCQISPVIEMSTDFENGKFKNEYVSNLNKVKESRDQRSDILKDEILFSSDEENDFRQREFQDIPQTVALETSFYDGPNVLEESMFVGFQTASNKSIQICTESFQKAKSMLDEDKNTNGELSLSELVKICDEKNQANSVKEQENVNSGKKLTGSKLNDIDCEILLTPVTVCDEKVKDNTETSINVELSEKNKESRNKYSHRFEISCNRNLLDKAIESKIDTDCDQIHLDQTDFKPDEVKGEAINIETKNYKEHSDDVIYDKINDDLLIQEFENIEMSLEEKETNDILNQNNLEGFKTASNLKITISDVAKANIKDIFQDIDLGEVRDNPNELEETRPDNSNCQVTSSYNEKQSEAAFSGFKTANNKNINITAQAMSKSKTIFHEIDAEITKYIDDSSQDQNFNVQFIEDLNLPSTSKSSFVGFKTANNKDIKITDFAMNKYKTILKNIDNENINTCDKVEKPLFEGFKTASNKDVKVSKSALLKSKKIFQDIDIDQDDLKTDDPIKTKDNNDSCGFKTASRKTVTISEESFDKSKRLLNELNDKETINDTQLCDIVNKNESRAFAGFQTASNNPVYVSKEAMDRSRKLFQDIDENYKVDEDTSASKIIDATAKKSLDERKLFDESRQDESKCIFVGFKTASNKNVNISKEAMAKCKNIFDDLDAISLPIDAKNPEAMIDFQTANNKKVFVTKEAIEKAKDIFKDNEPKPLVGFQTVSKNRVKVSEEAIEQTKLLSEDIEIEENKPKAFMGFQTASKKKVEVSKEAIEKTKLLFEDIEIENNDHAFVGFQTASKKKVVVSEEAIARSKQLLDDIDKTNEKDMENNKLNNDLSSVGDIMKDKNSGIDNITNIFSFQKACSKISNTTKNVLETPRKTIECQVQTKSETGPINIDSIINTQVLQNFEESLCTEDFDKTPRNKRSGSPILSCPKAKKRKIFKTPYKGETDKKTVDVIKVIEEYKCKIATTVIKFTENYKKNKFHTLKDLENCGDDKIKTADTYISNFNLENILYFEFSAQRNDITKTKMGVEQLKNLFLHATNKNLIPDGWMDNHLKLILWKLLSYEIKFPNLNFVCTVQNVIDQLKYRYDKELYNAERPALRKILERDDVSTKTMVLCVAGIFVDGVSVSSVANTENIELLLTDGWYFVKATIDRMMAKFVYDRRIVIGCKIITIGAELVNCEQGMAPWEDTTAVRLKLSGNSTRLAKWDSRLGYTRAAILSHLSSVRIDGGKVCRVRVFVARVYPLLYVEKFEDGSTVTRSERLEHLHQMKCENERELMMERIYEEVQKELSDQESQDSEGIMEYGKRRCYESGCQIAKMMKISKDPMEFRAQLTSSQVQLLQDHTSKHRDRVIQHIQNKIQERVTNRNVVTLARGRVADVKIAGNTVTVTKGMLSVWKPNDAILNIFKEGSWVEVMNVVPTAMRNSELHITAGRQSVFRPTKYKNDSVYLQSLLRKCYKISDVSLNPAMSTDYNEIDTVGIVFLIEPTNREFESSRNFQNVYISDADKNIICINFWGGIKKFGFENIFDTGQIVSCANLQKRAGNTRKNIPQFRVTEFSLFTKTPKNVQAREMIEDLNKKLFGLDRRKFCEDCVAIKNNYTAIRCLNNENESPYRMNRSDYSFARNKMFIDTPVNQKKYSDDLNFNLSGLDFESTFKQDTQELSPKTLLRKKRVNEKIARLRMYGEPPPLNPISIINKSLNAANSYKSPLPPKNSMTSLTTLPGNNNATPNQNLPSGVAIITNSPKESPKALPRESNGSTTPVISMKRSYAKSVPVKLNFSESADISVNKVNSVDHFAEDFDGSPPLSLD